MLAFFGHCVFLLFILLSVYFQVRLSDKMVSAVYVENTSRSLLYMVLSAITKRYWRQRSGTKGATPFL